MTIKKITSLTLTDKNGNAGYVDLKQITTNQNNISVLSERVQKLEDGDFQYAEVDFALPQNFSKMIIGTYYLVPYTKDGQFTNIDSSNLHHFDVLVRRNGATKVTKIRTQYVQANMKDVAYVTKENVFQKVNTFNDVVNTNNTLNAAEVATNTVHQKVTGANASAQGLAKFAITQTDADGVDSAGHNIKTNKNLANVELNTLNGHRKAALVINDNSNTQISIEHDGTRVRTFAPIPHTDNGDDTEIATIKNIKELNSRIKKSESNTAVTLQNYPVRDETNNLITQAEQRTLTTVSQNYPNNTKFNNTITDTKQELNNSIATKLSTSTFNTFITQYNTDKAKLLTADANNTQAIANTNTRVDEAFNQLSNHNSRITTNTQSIANTNARVDEAFNQLANHNSRITTNTNNITNLNNALNNKIKVVSNLNQANQNGILYLIF